MRQSDIVDALTAAIENKVFGEWRHEGFICGNSSEHINFEIDGKEYVLRIHEVKEGEHWSEAETQKPRARHCPDYRAFDTEKMVDEAWEWHRQNKLFGNTEQLKGGVQE